MNVLFSVLIALGTLALVFYIREKIKAYSVKAVLIKSVVSVLFLAVAVCGAFSSDAAATFSVPALRMAALVIVGQIFGLLGDIWLDFKYVFPKEDKPFTYAGFTVFGVGHVLFLIGLLLRFFPKGKPLYVIVPILLGVLVSAGNLLLEKKMKLDFGKMRAVVFIYGVLLFSVVALSGSLALYNRGRAVPLDLFFIGAVLFAASDFVLSGTYFGKGKERTIDIILNYATYYPAQFLIASSLLFLS